MAVYSKLLLSAGGGVISSAQQAGQVKNTVTLLIGLGGTGMDCLRAIKAQVYTRLRPDNPASGGAGYEHIRFLGVDTIVPSISDCDELRGSLNQLEQSELFSIANYKVHKVLQSPGLLKIREDLSWLNWENMKAPDLLPADPTGIRQVGRFRMMDRSRLFMARVEAEISAAKAGLNAPAVNIHIFSGLCGSTGSGCFLDVCYMVRHIAQKLGGVTTFGWFFLPDVNLSRIPFSDRNSRRVIQKNGCAAMKELDYCMGFPHNGGGFTQKYQDHIDIDWREPPVDVCHVVSGEDSANGIMENPYDHAMNVTAECIVDDLIDHPWSADIGGAPAKAHMEQGRASGANLSYCAVGGACAYIPWREINTYLLSELFARFAQIAENIPDRAEVEQLAFSALAPGAKGLSELYNSLYRELCSGADDSYTFYTDDWKYVRDFGDSEMVRSYINQTAVKLSQVSGNRQGMLDDGNERSLINRIRAKLDEIIRDAERGPIFAHNMISAAQNRNLLNIIDSLIQEGGFRCKQESAHILQLGADAEAARSDFVNCRKRRLLDNNQMRFNDYEYRLMQLERHKLALRCHEELRDLLWNFGRQLNDVALSYYSTLSQVMDTLFRTFKENRDVLASGKLHRTDSSFAVPIVTVEELSGSLDAEVEKLNISHMLRRFIDLFLDHEDVWLKWDENKIARLVNTFFEKIAFPGMANKPLTSFLRDRYGVGSDVQLVDKVYDEWLTRLAADASFLFPFNDAVWPESRTDQAVRLSFPASSDSIHKAAVRMCDGDNLWQLRGKDFTDRILVMRTACGLPLGAYNKCAEYENAYLSGHYPGIHSYEGKPVPGMAFDDWRKLPPLTP